jgi:ABC-2 type transport system ATP-binding protein
MIELKGLTKQFANGKGIFDLNLTVKKGEVFGYVGPNGAGKSTTIRHLLGFLKPTSGTATIAGLDCWRDAPKIHQRVGYLPGEISLFEEMTGRQILQFVAKLRKLDDLRKQDELIERFQLEADVPVRKMSKGMKQKVGLILAFMHDPDLLILDEPTSGLDPLMQRVFVDLILEEKKRGKTIFMSSHQFPEIEKTCDRVGMIKDGRLIVCSEIEELRQYQRKIFEITLKDEQEIEKLRRAGISILVQKGKTVEAEVQGDLTSFLQVLAECQVQDLVSRPLQLEELFLHFYDQSSSEEGIA